MLFLIQMALIAIAVLTAFWVGGVPEKIGSLILLFAAVINDSYYVFVAQSSYRSVDIFHLILDASIFASSFILAMIANRIWTMPFSSAALLAVFGHIVRAIDFQMEPLVYAVLIRVPFWVSIAILFGGIYYHARFRRVRTNRRRAR